MSQTEIYGFTLEEWSSLSMTEREEAREIQRQEVRELKDDETSRDFFHVVSRKVSSGSATNAEFMYWLMETGGRTGAMKQMFIIEAIRKWAEYIIKNEDVVLAQMEGSMIHGPAWINAAKEIKEELSKKYGN